MKIGESVCAYLSISGFMSADMSMPVRTPAGCTVFTRILYSPSSFAIVLASPTIPNFVAV